MAPEPADGRGPADTPPPASVEEALARAARHGRVALAEALAASRALADAGSLAATGQPVPGDGTLGWAGRVLDELVATLSSTDAGDGAGLLDAVAEALESEIARWEARAREDPDARAVLRAYLGLREILWELGVRPAPPGGGNAAGGSARGRGRRGAGGGGRVQRVPVEE